MLARARNSLAAAALALMIAAPCAAQQRTGVMGELLKDVTDVQTKLVSLARAMPADKLAWRPAAGVRSVGEVLLHVAADNYFMPAAVGVQPPAASNIRFTDFATVGAFEKQALSRDATADALQTSFAHLTKAMADTPDARLDERVNFFGQDMSVRQVWIITTTHLHEHLGQAIAYARSNGVVPPWSRKGS